MNLEGLKEKIMGIYSSAEDAYYNFLDKIDEHIPIYKLIDPIDRVIPSFILFILFILLLLLLVAWTAFVFVTGGFGGGAVFIVQDELGVPLSGIEVKIEHSAGIETYISDAQGEFSFALPDETVRVTAEASGYEKYSRNHVVKRGDTGPNIITLEKAVETGTMQLNIRIVDSSGESIKDQVKLTFSCSSNRASPPAGKTTRTGSASVSVEIACGTLTTKASATGYNDGKSVDSVKTAGTITITLSAKDTSNGNLWVKVVDAETDKALSGIMLGLQRETSSGSSFVEYAETGSSGTHSFDGLYAGSYLVVAEDDSEEYISKTSGSVAVLDGKTADLTIGMQRRDESTGPAEKALLQFIDEDSGDYIYGVMVSLYADDVFSKTAESVADGSVEFKNLDPETNYDAVAEHEGYLTKVIVNLPLIANSSRKAEKVFMIPVTEENAGTAKVKVTKQGGTPAESAAAMLYSTDFSFPIGIATTGSSGEVSFYNLPPLTYYAYAELGDLSGTSSEEGMDDGETINLFVALDSQSSEGGIRAGVEDGSGAAIEGALVEFFDSVTGEKLGEKQSDAGGLVEEMKLAPGELPYMRASKAGFLTHTTAAYEILPSTTIDVKITLQAESPDMPEPPDFDFKLSRVLNTHFETAEVMSADTTYNFLFTITLPDEFSDVESVVRAGLQENETAGDSIVVIKGISHSPASATFSACYDSGDNYADCDITADDAKQVRVSYGVLPKGTYDFMVKAYVKPLSDGEQEESVVEIRYGANAEYGDVTTFRPDEETLYLASFPFGPITDWDGDGDDDNDGGGEGDASIILELTDPSKSYMSRKHTFDGNPFTVPAGMQFRLKYILVNRSDQDFTDFPIEITTESSAIKLNNTGGNIGLVPAGTSKTGAFLFETLEEADAAELVVTAVPQTGEVSKTAKLIIVSPLGLEVKLQPDKLPANISTGVTAKVYSGIKLMKGAFITVTQNTEAGDAPLSGLSGTTDDRGNYTFTFGAYDYPATFKVHAEKIGYAAGFAEISVAGSEGGKDDYGDDGELECIEIEPMRKVLNVAGSGTNFTVRNVGCPGTVWVSLGKATGSDISTTPGIDKDGEIVLAIGESANVKVYSKIIPGVHPVFVYGNFDGGEKLKAGV
ncbi:MAG: carboxypeptidase-like regulatory domain-containing protein, partial [Candidatus Diapherotrites archaeon]